MKKILNLIKYFLLPGFLCYIPCVFIAANPNPFEWGVWGRIGFVVAWMFFIFLFLVLYAYAKHENEKAEAAKKEGCQPSKWSERLAQVQEAQKKAQENKVK